MAGWFGGGSQQQGGNPPPVPGGGTGNPANPLEQFAQLITHSLVQANQNMGNFAGMFQQGQQTMQQNMTQALINNNQANTEQLRMILQNQQQQQFQPGQPGPAGEQGYRALKAKKGMTSIRPESDVPTR